MRTQCGESDLQRTLTRGFRRGNSERKASQEQPRLFPGRQEEGCSQKGGHSSDAQTVTDTEGDPLSLAPSQLWVGLLDSEPRTALLPWTSVEKKLCSQVTLALGALHVALPSL